MVQQHDDEMGEIKKGPWKEEEDQVLIKHVNKYGPRDWSSIRSKGLLRRTGKSCRLRWVNKLRPHLKTYVHINHFLVCNYVRVFNESDEISFSLCVCSGVKFSAEEERIVIDLQAQFGNKWARIATYLTGRTDNDVKNFWSSRQKRLARILHTSTPPPSSTTTTNPHNDTTQPETPAFHLLPSFPVRYLIQRIIIKSRTLITQVSSHIFRQPTKNQWRSRNLSRKTCSIQAHSFMETPLSNSRRNPSLSNNRTCLCN